MFHDFPAGKMYSVMQEWVFPFIKNLHSDKNSAYSKYMDDAIFKLPTALLLSKVVDSLDEIYDLMNETQNADVHGELRGDVRGDVYEYLLSKIAAVRTKWTVQNAKTHHSYDGRADGSGCG